MNKRNIQETKGVPKKWYVVRNSENYKDLNKWSNDTFDRGRNVNQGDYKAYLLSDRGIWGVATSTYGYTEITTEQFRKYIIKEKATV